jgi:transposase
MPRKAKQPTPALPEWVDVKEMAAATGVKEASIRSAVYVASKVEAETGEWPKTGIPKPDQRRPHLQWARTRRDVQDHMKPKRYPLLEDEAELRKAIDRTKSASAVAKEIGCNKQTVITALDRYRIPVPEGTAPSALDGYTLEQLEAARVRPDGTRRPMPEAAALLGVTHPTYRQALRRAEAREGQLQHA